MKFLFSIIAVVRATQPVHLTNDNGMYYVDISGRNGLAIIKEDAWRPFAILMANGIDQTAATDLKNDFDNIASKMHDFQISESHTGSAAAVIAEITHVPGDGVQHIAGLRGTNGAFLVREKQKVLFHLNCVIGQQVFGVYEYDTYKDLDTVVESDSESTKANLGQIQHHPHGELTAVSPVTQDEIDSAKALAQEAATRYCRSMFDFVHSIPSLKKAVFGPNH
jgi:hypothetical protein